MMEIMDLYRWETCMMINTRKSSISFMNILDEEQYFFNIMFPYSMVEMENGTKCLGFYLKPNDNTKRDRGWMVAKVEKILTFWCNRWLSRGGRLILVKYVLEAILVY